MLVFHPASISRASSALFFRRFTHSPIPPHDSYLAVHELKTPNPLSNHHLPISTPPNLLQLLQSRIPTPSPPPLSHCFKFQVFKSSRFQSRNTLPLPSSLRRCVASSLPNKTKPPFAQQTPSRSPQSPFFPPTANHFLTKQTHRAPSPMLATVYWLLTTPSHPRNTFDVRCSMLNVRCSPLPSLATRPFLRIIAHNLGRKPCVLKGWWTGMSAPLHTEVPSWPLVQLSLLSAVSSPLSSPPLPRSRPRISRRRCRMPNSTSPASSMPTASSSAAGRPTITT